ncbi:unnamed protein product [Macrosiphum euphorbiae]|uniref:Uncharacterized protein n=1 Tax=Macrosiphum euphorbiae TaxID=13131 RepID=A0AAV0XFW9_9HEMI|nr:unnamed protein product [Macrosiphum euphorbiae]
MNRGKVLTSDNINVLLEQIDNGNTTEFEGREEEEDFDMVNNIRDNEDIDQLLLENYEYFEQLENSKLNFGYGNTSVDASQTDTCTVINSNNNLNPNVQQIKYINTMKLLRTNHFKPKKKLIRSSPDEYNDSERHYWTPINYFNQYINEKTIENMVNCTNVKSVVETGKSILVTSIEMKRFI